MLSAKINVMAIDKARLFPGAKGKYLDILLIETPNDQYGNSHMIVQSVTKEERLAGVKGNVLGNAKIIGQPQQRAAAPAQAPKTTTTTVMKSGIDEDVQF